MPKHTGRPEYFVGALKVCNDADGQWLTVKEFTDALYQYVHSINAKNEETRNNDNSHYTKCAQAPAYLGFIKRDSYERNAKYAITDSGKAFYKYYVENQRDQLIDELVKALSTVTFGKNNYGCGTDSKCEPLGILIKSAIILDGITYKEYAYILRYMDGDRANLSHLLNLLQDILDFREHGIEINKGDVDSIIRILSDAKMVAYLEYFGVMKKTEQGRFVVAPAVLNRYASTLLNLRINNTPIEEKVSLKPGIVRSPDESVNKYKMYINALRTKPFLLLAGISGTGKSRLVRELAYMSCPRNSGLDNDPSEPGNFCLIEVKPNWHDSTELLGYYSNLSGRYEFTKFVYFVYKATMHPSVPFFVCLDEMNLAPVEQYFAEYLSVLETRMLDENGKIISSELISKGTFANCKKVHSIISEDESEAESSDLCSEDYIQMVEYFSIHGLRIPENLFVVGTVNMDDTTYQFSRKVIDRAFTIEMNGGNLSEMFNENDSLKYYANDSVLDLKTFKPKYVSANDALAAQSEENREYIKKYVPALLNQVNKILEGTPFGVSYRVQNEFVLYLCSLLENSKSSAEDKIEEAFLSILMNKILPRIQGDDKLLKTVDNSSVLKKLDLFVENEMNKILDKTDVPQLDLLKQVREKLKVMNTRLESSYFTNFFG